MRPFPAVLLLAVACRRGESAPHRHSLIDARDNYDPRSLDPALSTDVPTGRAVGYLFDGLTGFSAEARVQPALAERWDVSADGLTYTFHLRRGVTFHDGSPFRAADVVRSFERVLSPATRGGRGEPLYPIRGARDYAAGKVQSIAGLAAPNDSTVVVNLASPNAIFIKLLAMPVASIVPNNTVGSFGEHPIGTGPWRLVEWRHDDYLLFARNPSYWAGAPKAESLRARVVAEPSTAVAEFQAGNVDVIQVPPEEVARWRLDPYKRRHLATTPALELVYIAINTRRGPLKDPRVRLAINHAIDGGAIVKDLLNGAATRAAGVIPPALGGYDSTRRPYAFDTAGAKRLLAQAGYPGGIDVELWTSTTPIFVRIAETAQAYLRSAGIRARIVQRESAAAREAARNGQVDMIVKDWYADYPDAENFLFFLLGSANAGVGGNVSFYSNPEFDQLIARSRLEQDESKRNALYRAADSIAFGDAPMVFLYFADEELALQQWLRGFRPPVIFNGERWLGARIDTAYKER